MLIVVYSTRKLQGNDNKQAAGEKKKLEKKEKEKTENKIEKFDANTMSEKKVKFKVRH